MDDGEKTLVQHVDAAPLKDIMNLLADTFYVLDEAGHLVLWNQRFELATGLSAEQLRTTHMLELLHPTDRPAVASAFCSALEGGQPVQLEARLLADGRAVPYFCSGALLHSAGQRYLLGTGVDLSQHQCQNALAGLRERALHAASNGIVITRCEGASNPIEYVNPAFEHITGYSQREVLGIDSRFMACGEQDAAQRKQLAAAIAAREPVTVVLRNARKNGDQFWNRLSVTPVLGDNGSVTHFIGIIEDITELKQRTAELEYRVTHDALTGLANRTLLRDRLEQALHAARRDGGKVAVILMDLNKFKEINDTLGHDAGDHVLCMVAQRLQSALRDSDTVARLGGDEFVLVLAEQPTLRFTLGMIERIRCAMAHDVQFEGRSLPVGASMGVAVYPQDGDSFSALLRAADAAMYESKNGGQDSVHFYSSDMASASQSRQRMEQALREAIDGDCLYLKYQPNVCVQTGRIVGMEALLRWRHPELGELLPAAFLAEAEENGLIVQLGRRVLDEVCGTIKRLGQLGHPTLPVTMNASHREFVQHDYLSHVERTVAAHGIDPACLQLELREAQLMRHPDLARRVCGGMRDMGARLSVDEFGGGLSNLACLRALPIDQLKMSAAPVREIGLQGRNGALAKTMLDIGRNLEIKVVATGVETRGQHDFLARHGCASMQGHYVSQALSRRALEHWLHRRGGHA
jgi:diguanylate cyclase (GGDEF)-like protein/PAS domain S-box-containing protein